MRMIPFHTAISESRYFRYLLACGHKKRDARVLYRANIRLSKELYSVIGTFEIVLRNSINRQMISLKGNEWLRESVSPGGFLTGKDCERSCISVQTVIQALGQTYTNDNAVAKLAFGFWTYMFAAKEFAASGSTLLQIFPFRPLGLNQKEIFKDLVKINAIRNRVAHFEPLCFDGNTISTDQIIRRYNLMIDLLKWMNCNPTKLLWGIDRVYMAIAAINNLTKKSFTSSDIRNFNPQTQNTPP